MLSGSDLWIVAALAAACAVTAGIVAAMGARRHKRNSILRDVLKVCFVYNLAVVLFLTMRPSAIYKTYAVHLIPFSTIAAYFRHVAEGTLDLPTILYNMAGNALLLLPTGLLLPAIWPVFRRFWKCLLVCALFSIGIEVIQFLLTAAGLISRTTDIDDVILNILGAAAGYGLFSLKRSLTAHRQS